MVDTLKDKLEKLLQRIPESKRKVLIIVCVGFLLLICVLPEINIKTDSGDNAEPSEFQIQNSYIEQTEQRLCELISSISGAGKTKVMLTLESSQENVYAADINSEKSEYVVIKTDSGEGGMLLKVIRPEIRGVAVVCEGGDKARVKVDIINAVSSSLGISSTRISIAKMDDRSD